MSFCVDKKKNRKGLKLNFQTSAEVEINVTLDLLIVEMLKQELLKT